MTPEAGEARDDAEFAVWIMWADRHDPIARGLKAEGAIKTAHRICQTFDIIARDKLTLRQPEAVIITDGGDHAVFRWEPEAGVVFPPDAATAYNAARKARRPG